MFQNFPYTDMHQLNLDWIIKEMKNFLEQKQEIIDGLSTKVNKPIENPNGNPDDVMVSLGNGETVWMDPKTGLGIQEAVDEWLEQHPEATTTVEDGSLTLEKFSEQLKNETYNNYVTPQMFGAVGDGVEDDTEAIQAALDYAHENNYIPVCLISDYKITSTLYVPERVSVFALTITEARNKIYVDENVNIVFDCAERTVFKNVAIDGLNGTYRDNTTAFYFRGTSAHNSDSQLLSCQIMRMGTGAYCPSRNVDFIDSLFSHCRYGITIELPSGVHAMRGMNILGCRFHGIGEEYALYNGVMEEILIHGDCAGIVLKADNYVNSTDQEADVIIENCISDQSGTFITGYAQNCLVSGCYIKSFSHPAFILDSGVENVYKPSGAGAWLINNCIINGVYGTDGQGVHHGRPDNLIKINKYGRITIDGCVIGRVTENPVKIENASTDIVLSNNILTYTTRGTAFVEIYGGSKAICRGNVNTTGMPLTIATGNSNDTTSHVTNIENSGFAMLLGANTFKNIEMFSGMRELATITSGAFVDGILNCPLFYVRIADAHTWLRVEHYTEGYFSSSAGIEATTGKILTIYVDQNNSKVYLSKSTGSAAPTYDTSTTLYLLYPD